MKHPRKLKGKPADDGKAVHARQRRGVCTVEPIRNRQDIVAIKEALAERPRDYALFVTGIHCGLRGGDLLALRWDDVLTMEERIADRIRVVESKTLKTRTLPLQENAQRALERLYRHEKPEGREELVFRNRQGSARLTTGRLRQLVRRWCRAAGMEGHFGSHTLRKTFGYHLRKAGFDVALLMSIYGHSSPAVTLRYLGVTQDECEKAALTLNL